MPVYYYPEETPYFDDEWASRDGFGMRSIYNTEGLIWKTPIYSRVPGWLTCNLCSSHNTGLGETGALRRRLAFSRSRLSKIYHSSPSRSQLTTRSRSTEISKRAVMVPGVPYRTTYDPYPQTDIYCSLPYKCPWKPCRLLTPHHVCSSLFYI